MASLTVTLSEEALARIERIAAGMGRAPGELVGQILDRAEALPAEGFAQSARVVVENAGKTVEQRLAAIEAALVEIARRLDGLPPLKPWYERLSPPGDLEAFDEAMALGRAIREADRPPEDEG
jgi:hypothetical protein